ncbi:MAG: response regulator [Kiloniellales bacterium]
MNILLVDDDQDLRGMVMTLLARDRFEAREAETAADMRRQLSEQTPDLILLDVRLPDADGFELLKEIRQDSAIPVIMLTGVDTPVDRVLGLEFGADDYICKPFEPRELVARIKTVLRRSNPREEVGGDQESVTLHFAGYVLDLTHRQLMREGGEDIELTSGEFDLLRALAEAPNRPLTRDRLLDLTRSREWSPFDRSVDVLIGRIRKKLEPDPTRPTLIKTVRTVGYILASKVERRGARANSNPTASGMTA